jgi:hypothetical protein
VAASRHADTPTNGRSVTTASATPYTTPVDVNQCELAERFGDLPFSLVGKAKPSLQKYRSLIAGARNRTFHDLFASGRSFRAPLKSTAFEAASLRLFREYKARSSPALEFRDRELVELLQGFTRAAEQPVPLGFWENDLAVMRAVEDVAVALHQALVLVSPGS